jgi:hypothetical protein
MADENLGVQSHPANARIPINEATVELLCDVQGDFQTARTLLEAIDHFVDEAHAHVGPCAEEKQPQYAANAQLHAMVMVEQLRRQLSEMELKIDGTVAACLKAKKAVQ